LLVYISLALNYFQNKQIFSDKAEIIGRGRFSSKVHTEGRFCKKCWLPLVYMNWIDRRSQPSRRGCHSWKLQDQAFSLSERFGTVSIFSTRPSSCTWPVFCCVQPRRSENQHLKDRVNMSLHKLKAVHAACQRQYTKADGEVQAPWDSIHEWRKAHQRDRHTVCYKPSSAWVLSLCGYKTAAFYNYKVLRF